MGPDNIVFEMLNTGMQKTVQFISELISRTYLFLGAKPFCAMALNLYAILAFVSVLSIAVQSCASLHVVLDLSGVSLHLCSGLS